MDEHKNVDVHLIVRKYVIIILYGIHGITLVYHCRFNGDKIGMKLNNLF